MPPQHSLYGIGDNSYQAAGELTGLTKLVDDFYDNMSTFPEAKIIRDMHPKNLTLSRKKLVYFLAGWLGGPRLYAEHFGGISIPASHQHLVIGNPEGDAWLFCMQKALEKQPYQEDFKTYLIEQLKFPTERIKDVCSHNSL
jgi:hemoglobin